MLLMPTHCVCAMQGLPLDAESIAAGIVADAVHEGRLSLEAAEDRLGPICALLIQDILKVIFTLRNHNLLALACDFFVLLYMICQCHPL